MRRVRPLALVISGPLRMYGLGRLSNLAEHLGLVKASSFRQASRISNTLRCGQPVHRYEDLEPARLILICAPDEMVAGIVAGLLEAGLDWNGKAVLLSGGTLDSGALRELAARGAGTASFAWIEAYPVPDCFIEGDRTAVRAARRLFEEGGGRAVEVRRSARGICAAGTSLASWILLPLVDASLSCFRHAGLTPRRGRLVVERLVERSLRSYLKGGRRSWRGPATPEARRAFRMQLEALRGTDPALAETLLTASKLSLHYLGKSTDWLERETLPARRAAAGSGG